MCDLAAVEGSTFGWRKSEPDSPTTLMIEPLLLGGWGLALGANSGWELVVGVLGATSGWEVGVGAA